MRLVVFVIRGDPVLGESFLRGAKASCLFSSPLLAMEAVKAGKEI